MDQYDYKTINIPKGAELSFHRVFQTFGFRPILNEEVTMTRSTDGRLQGDADMEHYYEAGEADEALLGLVLHKNDAPVDRYIRLTYGRNRFDSRFENYAKAESIYGRLTYDAYRLATKAKEHRRKRKLPLLVSFLLWALLILGLVAVGLGVWKGAPSKNPSLALNGSFFVACFWFGLGAALLGLLGLLLIGLPRFILHQTAMLKAVEDYVTLKDMKTQFRSLFRNSEDVPEINLPIVEKIETIHHLD